MPDVDLILRARDGLFFKDARGWFTSESGRTHALAWPHPTTLLGALRSAYGRRREDARGRALARGEWPTVTAAVALGASLPVRAKVGGRCGPAARLWPRPADTIRMRDEGGEHWETLEPLPPRAGVTVRADADGISPGDGLWFPRPDAVGKPLSRPAWWTDDELAAWVRGAPVAPNVGDARELAIRTQAHVSVSRDAGTAVAGALFTTEVRETVVRSATPARAHDEWSIAVRVTSDDDVDAWARTPLVLGGDGRLGFAEAAPHDLFAPPDLVAPSGDGAAAFPDVLGLRLLVVTPAHFSRGWLPDGFEFDGTGYTGSLPGLAPRVRLRAALVDRPTAVSGWDVAAGQARATRRLVPSGSVYFVTRVDGQAFGGADALRLWFACWGADTASGLGRIVAGAWAPRAEGP
jgi:CRISPR-associated protein Cmr3